MKILKMTLMSLALSVAGILPALAAEPEPCPDPITVLCDQAVEPLPTVFYIPRKRSIFRRVGHAVVRAVMLPVDVVVIPSVVTSVVGIGAPIVGFGVWLANN